MTDEADTLLTGQRIVEHDCPYPTRQPNAATDGKPECLTATGFRIDQLVQFTRAPPHRFLPPDAAALPLPLAGTHIGVWGGRRHGCPFRC